MISNANPNMARLAATVQAREACLGALPLAFEAKSEIIAATRKMTKLRGNRISSIKGLSYLGELTGGVL